MIRFDPTEHKYFDETGAEYISATTLIKLFCDPFEEEQVAIRYAEKHGQTPEYWIKQWNDKRDTRCSVGSQFHKMKEDTVAGRGLEVRSKVFDVLNHELQFMRGIEMENLPTGIYLEMPLWNSIFKVSGTPDKVIIDREEEAFVDIDDYKTNESIDLESFMFKSGRRKMMLGPLRHLMDCNYVHYTLQLSLYAYMLECFGYTPRSLRILHYEVDNEGNVLSKEPKVYPVQYLKHEVLMMMDYFRVNGKKQLKFEYTYGGKKR